MAKRKSIAEKLNDAVLALKEAAYRAEDHFDDLEEKNANMAEALKERDQEIKDLLKENKALSKLVATQSPPALDDEDDVDYENDENDEDEDDGSDEDDEDFEDDEDE